MLRRARRPRFLPALAATILIALCPRPAPAQTRCSVEQEQFTGIVTGHFRLGGVTASLTLPRGVGKAAYRMALLVEVSPNRGVQTPEELVIRSGLETVPLRDGALLHVVHRPGQRLVFSVAASDGPPLCSWEPPIVFAKKEYRVRNDLKSIRGTRSTSLFHITGEPISLVFQHPYSDGRQEFRLDGAPAPILMESATQFLLRDPHPTAGVRTLESQGEAIPLHFAAADKRLLPSSPDREVLEVTLRGLRLGLHRSALLFIFNLDPQTAKLACGISRTRPERAQSNLLLIAPFKVRDGSVTVSCEVRLLHDSPASLGEFTFQVIDFVSSGLIPFLPLRG